jgi:hypothetical protein
VLADKSRSQSVPGLNLFPQSILHLNVFIPCLLTVFTVLVNTLPRNINPRVEDTRKIHSPPP